MSDNLDSLIPGGGIVAAAIGLLSWFMRNARDERREHSEALKEVKAEHAKAKTDWERAEGDLRRRLADEETVISGLKDQVADLKRERSELRAKLGIAEGRASWMQGELSKAGGPALWPPPPIPGDE